MPDSTYAPNLAADEGLNQARMELGDVGHIVDDAGDQQWILKDVEITALIAGYGYSEGVAKCADSCITRCAQQPDLYEDESQARVEWKSRIQAWKYLAARLRSKVGEKETATETPMTAVGQAINNPSGFDKLGLP